ncbi:hypothetical protein EJ08DRAFT_664535 [Tothia fuscella]|uniref:Uncharacterized protein n=1 Tax=Tothia fuscella TaxID=1048955 RepID=A0A9P4NIR4_9PEZI|nr:hypothetical protein EJ08DRAFT_664535 [Tothia fuscella]
MAVPTIEWRDWFIGKPKVWYYSAMESLIPPSPIQWDMRERKRSYLQLLRQQQTNKIVKSKNQSENETIIAALKETVQQLETHLKFEEIPLEISNELVAVSTAVRLGCALKEQVTATQDGLATRDDLHAAKDRECVRLTEELAALEASLKTSITKDEIIAAKQRQCDRLTEGLATLNAKVKTTTAQDDLLTAKDGECEKLAEKLATSKQKAKSRKKIITSSNELLTSKEEQCQRLSEEVSAMKAKLEAKSSESESQATDVSSLQSTLQTQREVRENLFKVLSSTRSLLETSVTESRTLSAELEQVRGQLPGARHLVQTQDQKATTAPQVEVIDLTFDDEEQQEQSEGGALQADVLALLTTSDDSIMT